MSEWDEYGASQGHAWTAGGPYRAVSVSHASCVLGKSLTQERLPEPHRIHMQEANMALLTSILTMGSV